MFSINGRRIGILLAYVFLYYGFSEAGFLWFEIPPSPEDPCVMTVIDSIPLSWKDVHPDPSCDKGGLLWYGTYGGVHLHFFQDLQKKQEFKLCLTGGEANTVAISYDYMGKHWTPIVFPTYMADVEERYRCKRSLNGTLDLYARGLRKLTHYFTFFTWEIEPSELDQTHYQPDYSKKNKKNSTKAEDLDLEEIRKKLESGEIKI